MAIPGYRGFNTYSFGSPMPDRTFVPSSCSTQTVIQNNYTHQDNFPNPLPLWNPVGTAGVGWAGPGAMTVNCAVATDGAQQALACVPGVQNTLDLTITYGNNDILIDVIDPATMLSLPGYPILYPAQMFGTVQNIQLLFIAPPPPLPPGLPNVIVQITSPGGPFPFPDMFILNYVAISTQTSVQQQVCWDEDYRFGFNGKEKDNEASGQGNQYDYGFRIYNPRLGRFLSVDPMRASYPWYTPYQYAGNRPINSIDVDGLEPKEVVTTDGSLTSPVINILCHLQISGEAGVMSNANVQYNSLMVLGLMTVGNNIYFGPWLKKRSESTQTNLAIWLYYMNHETGHLNQTELFGHSAIGKAAYIATFAGLYIKGVLNNLDGVFKKGFLAKVHDEAYLEITVSMYDSDIPGAGDRLGQWLLTGDGNELLQILQDETMDDTQKNIKIDEFFTTGKGKEYVDKMQTAYQEENKASFEKEAKLKGIVQLVKTAVAIIKGEGSNEANVEGD